RRNKRQSLASTLAHNDETHALQIRAQGELQAGSFESSKIQDDGKGGAVIVWQDERSGIYDIYAQRVDKNGTLKWGATGKMICNATGVQNDPKVDPDSLTGGAYIVWIDKRNGNYDLYAQKVDSSGNILWNNSGVVVSNAAGSQTAHDIMSNQGTNGLIIVWKDKRNADYDIYAQKLNSSGSALWTANGVVVTNAVKDQLNPNIVEDNSGGAIIVWQDSSNGSFDIRAQKLNAAGIKLWTPMGEIVGNAPGDQIQPKNIPDGKGGSIFAFQDYRAGNYDIYVHHLYTNGMVTGIENTGSSVYDAKAYPNPFSESLLIDLPVAGNVNLTLYDISGKTVALTKSAYQVDLQKRTILLTPATDQMNTGLYFIRITGESGEAKVLTVNYLKR
ncbi:MAG: T9SS type A sorting domain-containing protein, partial [Sphingobacteriales bacterium]